MFKLIPLILLAGCSSTASVIGTWTGKVNPFTTTMIIKADGTGVICSSDTRRTKIEKLTHSNGIIITEKGLIVTVEGVDGDVMEVEVDSNGSKEYTFYRDSNLKKAAWYCRLKLK